MSYEGFDSLNLGSGSKPFYNTVNVDIEDYSHLKIGIFVKASFDEKLPFPDNCFKAVFMNHALEHCKDIWFTIREIHRLLETNGKAFIKVPYWRWPTTISPLHHYHQFTWRSLDPLDQMYGLFKVKRRLKFYSEKTIWKILTYPLETIFNSIPMIYEASILSVLLPAVEINYELTRI